MKYAVRYYLLEIHIKRVIHTAHCQLTGFFFFFFFQENHSFKGTNLFFFSAQFYLWTDLFEIFTLDVKFNSKHIL